jgi:2-polyprenyl-3-methyl-5-hydroxy-6-metoxy-1,4-benzoquinol methylase
MKVTEYIGSQFGNPRGLAGKICCVIMNMFNKKLYGKVADTVLKHSGKNILDVGVGNGYLEKVLR